MCKTGNKVLVIVGVVVKKFFKSGSCLVRGCILCLCKVIKQYKLFCNSVK